MSQSNTYNKVNTCLPFEIFLQKNLLTQQPGCVHLAPVIWLSGGWGEDDALFSKKICQLLTKTDIQNWQKTRGNCSECKKRFLKIRKVAKKLPSNLWKAPGKGITCQNLIIPGGMVHRHFALCYKLLLPLHLYKGRHNTQPCQRKIWMSLHHYESTGCSRKKPQPFIWKYCYMSNSCTITNFTINMVSE